MAATKNYIRKISSYSYTPSSPGWPSVPGQPYIAPYTVWESVEVTTYSWKCTDGNGNVTYYDSIPGAPSPYPSGGGAGVFSVAIGGSGGGGGGSNSVTFYNYNGSWCQAIPETKTQLVLVSYPGQPYIAPIIGEEARDAEFEEQANLGWNAGAISKDSITREGALQAFPVPATGVIYGLTTAELTPGEGYAGIMFGFHIEQNRFRIVENGVAKTGFQTYTQGQRFLINRYTNSVQYIVGGTVVYDSFQTPPSGPLFADISLYATGDELWDAEFIVLDNEATSADSRAIGTTEAYSSLSSVITAAGKGSTAAYTLLNGIHELGAVSDGAGTASASSEAILSATAQADATSSSEAIIQMTAVATAAVSMKALVGTGASYDYDYSAASFKPFEAEGTGVDEFVPKYALSFSMLNPMSAGGTGLTGEISTSFATSMREIDGLAADRNYGESAGRMFPVMGFGGEDPVYDGALIDSFPALSTWEFYATGSPGDVGRMTGDLPTMTIKARSGGLLRRSIPALTLEATATLQSVGTLEEEVPRITFTATARLSGVGAMEGLLPFPTLESVGSGVGLEEDLPFPTITASGTATIFGIAEMTAPKITMQGAALAGSVARMSGTLPLVTLIPANIATLIAPLMRVDAQSTSSDKVRLVGGSAGALQPLSGVAADYAYTYSASFLKHLVVLGTGGKGFEAGDEAGAGRSVTELLPMWSVGADYEYSFAAVQLARMTSEAYTVVAETTLGPDSGITTSSTRALTVNVATGLVGELYNFSFDAVGEIDGSQFLVNDEGTYLYGGATDDGEAFRASATIAPMDNNSPRLKRLPYMYLNGRGDGGVYVTQLTADGYGDLQLSDNEQHVGFGNRRVKLSKGRKSRYFGLYIESKGPGFTVKGVELITQLSDRRR